MSQRSTTSCVYYRTGLSLEWKMLNFAIGTDFGSVRQQIIMELSILGTSVGLVTSGGDGQFYHVGDHHVVERDINVYVASIKQFVLVFGDLEDSILKRFEKVLSINGIVRGCQHVSDTFNSYTCEVTRRTVCMPSADSLRSYLEFLFRSARYTQYVILCHSVVKKGLLIGGKLIQVSDLANISPIGEPFNAIPNSLTCFAPNNIYLEAVASGRDERLLSAIQQITRGAPSGILLVSHAIRSVIMELRNFGCNAEAESSGYHQSDRLFLSQWEWPHTTSENHLGQPVRVQEQFGETFHFAVWVAIFPDLVGKFSRPGLTVDLHFACPNEEQFDFFEAVASTAYSYANPSLITASMQQFIAKTTLYSHNVGTNILIHAGKSGRFICTDIALKIKRRLLGIERGISRDCNWAFGRPKCVVLAVRKSSAATDTNSAVRDTPDSFIRLFLKTFKEVEVVVVGNNIETILRDRVYRTRDNILRYTELWNRCPPDQNKFRWQMREYQRIFAQHNACHVVGMWSGQLDMYALLGMRVLRIALTPSYTARIHGWSDTIGLPYHEYLLTETDSLTDEIQEAILEKFTELVNVEPCPILHDY